MAEMAIKGVIDIPKIIFYGISCKSSNISNDRTTDPPIQAPTIFPKFQKFA